LTTPMNISTPNPMRADARRNRQRLLDVAHEVFAAGGLDAPLDEIARRAGVGIGTLYRHFRTRDELVEALVAADLERISQMADDLLTSTDPDALDRWLSALVTHAATYRGLADSLVAASTSSTPFGAACVRLHTAGTALVRRAQALGVVRADLDPADAIDLATAVAWLTERDADRGRADRLLHAAIEGIRPQEDAPRRGVDRQPTVVA
jgi:AcrR family transcriptional regulator